MSYKILDVQKWERRPQYEFFKTFDEPFFGLSFDLDITNVYNKAKSEGVSVANTYMYFILKALNSVEALRTRIIGDKVVIFENIGVSSTVAREDKTFGFSYINFHDDFKLFLSESDKELERVRNSTDLEPNPEKIDTIHFSSIPWIRFTSISHARCYNNNDSVPKVSCGKIVKEGERRIMPIAIHVHHALADGLHVGLFHDELAKLVAAELL